MFTPKLTSSLNIGLGMISHLMYQILIVTGQESDIGK